jgi:hypothetical protein
MDGDANRLARNKYMREWKRRNKDKVNKTNKKWKDKNRSLVREKERGYTSRKAGTGIGYRKLWLSNIRNRAKRKGLPFNLTLDDIEIPSHCPVLGIPIKERSGRFHDSSPSIDRIIPSRGYVKDNVQIVSYRANRIKCHATLDELRRIVQYLERESWHNSRTDL